MPRPTRLDETLGLVVGGEAISGQVVHRAPDTIFETRATVTPGGDFLLMFPQGGHYGSGADKANDMLAIRSTDGGRTWAEPRVAFDIPYAQHGFVPLIPKGSTRIYSFGTQPIPELWDRQRGLTENTPIGYRYSDDDGHHWSEVRLIHPRNDPGFTGMFVMRMYETDAGTWLLAPHEGDSSYVPLQTRLYIMRSEDQGQTWDLLPRPRHGGWCVLQYGRMDEGRPINLGGGRVLLMIRTPEGHLWATRSEDDGKTWTDPQPTSLVHPDAPPMLCHLSDGKTLCAFHHNRNSVPYAEYRGLGNNPGTFLDRSEIWMSLSIDEGRTWSEPRFVYCNGLAPWRDNPFMNAACSYNDLFVHEGTLHVFLPHQWRRAVHLTIPESALPGLPTAGELGLA